jgi:hypothetical protein
VFDCIYRLIPGSRFPCGVEGSIKLVVDGTARHLILAAIYQGKMRAILLDSALLAIWIFGTVDVIA